MPPVSGNQHPVEEVMPILLKSGQCASREEAAEKRKPRRSMQHSAHRSMEIPDRLRLTRPIGSRPKAKSGKGVRWAIEPDFIGRSHLDSTRLDGLVFGDDPDLFVCSVYLFWTIYLILSQRVELRMVLVKPRSREGSVSERLCNVWLDDARDELVIVYETHTQDVCGCPSAHTGHPCLSVSTHRKSVAVRVCPSAHTGRPWLSISTHISTLVLGLSTLALLVACLGDFGTHGLSVQYTQDVRGCPPAHTGRPWLSEAVCQHTQDVRGCPCVSVSTHRTSVAVHQYTYQHAGPWTQHAGPRTQHAGPSRGQFGTSVGVRQHTQDVRVCPSAHTGPHTGNLWLSISTHISTLVLGLSTLTLPVDCSGDFGPRGLSVQYTPDVRECPPAHIGRLWLSVSVHVCPSVSVSTHRTSVAVHQYTFQHVGPWTQHAGPSRGLFGTSVAVHQYTYHHAGVGLSTLALSVDCSGDFGPRGLSVQYTQNVRVYPSAHIGRPCVSVSTHRTSVAVRQHIQNYIYQHADHTYQHARPSHGCTDFGQLMHHVSTHISTLALSVNCSCTDMDMSSSFDGLDCPSQSD
ncbi:hypothetical protein IGI04_042416 [Brassica rapa subsp. trilocularis]|uniref:SWIM-type domain-containing protein n=1 Tax=Brassica rapa subsp. trilocularis TaxID=1813537 RepID=A0ABQ7KIC8_BRACM|nr:hypothetical protein IGI04_042416 [Brassica rapa subsp. trilocularis]